MVEDRIRDRKQRIGKQREPLQQRSRQRREEILATTASLLEQVGFDDVTTILIAKELKISVGSLYHYFPNKQAILYALAEQWLEGQSLALEEIATDALETRTLEGFIDLAFDRILRVYREQRGMLPLTQAMWAVPELRDLEDRQDELMIAQLADMFRRVGLTWNKPERERRALLLLEMSHALFLSIVEETPKRAARSLRDLKALGVALLQQT